MRELDFDFDDLFRMELFHTSTSTTTSPIHNSLYSSTSIVDRDANFSLDVLAASVESTLAVDENGTIASSSTEAPGQFIGPPFGIISFSNLCFFLETQELVYPVRTASENMLMIKSNCSQELLETGGTVAWLGFGWRGSAWWVAMSFIFVGLLGSSNAHLVFNDQSSFRNVIPFHPTHIVFFCCFHFVKISIWKRNVLFAQEKN